MKGRHYCGGGSGSNEFRGTSLNKNRAKSEEMFAKDGKDRQVCPGGATSVKLSKFKLTVDKSHKVKISC